MTLGSFTFKPFFSLFFGVFFPLWIVEILWNPTENLQLAPWVIILSNIRCLSRINVLPGTLLVYSHSNQSNNSHSCSSVSTSLWVFRRGVRLWLQFMSLCGCCWRPPRVTISHNVHVRPTFRLSHGPFPFCSAYYFTGLSHLEERVHRGFIVYYKCYNWETGSN